MGFELPPPGTIPDLNDLETLVQGHYETLVSEFDALTADNPNGLAEACDPGETVGRFAAKLSSFLCYQCDETDRNRHQKIVSRTQSVAGFILARAFANRPYALSLQSLSEAADHPRTLERYIFEWPIEYLAARPAVCRLLMTYTEHLVDTPQEKREAYIAGGLLFAQVEEDRQTKYIAHQMRKFDADLHAFNNPAE